MPSGFPKVTQKIWQSQAETKFSGSLVQCPCHCICCLSDLAQHLDIASPSMHACESSGGRTARISSTYQLCARGGHNGPPCSLEAGGLAGSALSQAWVWTPWRQAQHSNINKDGGLHIQPARGILSPRQTGATSLPNALESTTSPGTPMAGPSPQGIFW